MSRRTLPVVRFAPLASSLDSSSNLRYAIATLPHVLAATSQTAFYPSSLGRSCLSPPCSAGAPLMELRRLLRGGYVRRTLPLLLCPGRCVLTLLKVLRSWNCSAYFSQLASFVKVLCSALSHAPPAGAFGRRGVLQSSLLQPPARNLRGAFRSLASGGSFAQNPSLSISASGSIPLITTGEEVINHSRSSNAQHKAVDISSSSCTRSPLTGSLVPSGTPHLMV